MVSRAPRTFGSLQTQGVCGRQGTGKEMGRLVYGIKGDTFFSGEKNFLAPTTVQQWVRIRYMSFLKLEVLYMSQG